MKHTNMVVIAILTFAIGILIGYLVWGKGVSISKHPGMHAMPDGSDMTSMMMDMNTALRGKTGDAFDEAFLSEMIVHHQGAIDMAQLALTNAKHQEIKDLANAIVAAQTKEIGEMKVWQKSWYTK